MRRVIFSTAIFVALSCCAFAQNLFLNGSFETSDNDVPEHWDKGTLYGDGGSVYVTGAVDAADGSAYVRTSTPPTVSPLHLKGWQPAVSNYDMLPNCRYRLTYTWRTGHKCLVRDIVFIEYGGIISGNSAFEYVHIHSNPRPLESTSGEWVTTSYEFETSPEEAWSKSFYFIFAATAQASTVYPVSASSMDYDNIQLELLEHYTTATCHISTFHLSTYDYTNTDCKIRFLTNDQEADHTVEKKNGAPPDIGSTPALEKYWIIDPFPGNFTATVYFSYTDDELSAAGLSESFLRLVRKEEGIWTEEPCVINESENVIQTESPISSFSTWAVVGPGELLVKEWFLYNESHMRLD